MLDAVRLARRYPRLSARDLVHLALMTRVGIDRIVSADADFDEVPEVRRLDPRTVAAWRGELD